MNTYKQHEVIRIIDNSSKLGSVLNERMTNEVDDKYYKFIVWLVFLLPISVIGGIYFVSQVFDHFIWNNWNYIFLGTLIIALTITIVKIRLFNFYRVIKKHLKD